MISYRRLQHSDVYRVDFSGRLLGYVIHNKYGFFPISSRGNRPTSQDTVGAFLSLRSACRWLYLL